MTNRGVYLFPCVYLVEQRYESLTMGLLQCGAAETDRSKCHKTWGKASAKRQQLDSSSPAELNNLRNRAVTNVEVKHHTIIWEIATKGYLQPAHGHEYCLRSDELLITTSQQFGFSDPLINYCASASWNGMIVFRVKNGIKIGNSCPVSVIKECSCMVRFSFYTAQQTGSTYHWCMLGVSQ